MKHLLTVIGISVFLMIFYLSSCNDEELIQMKESGMDSRELPVSLQEALQRANEFFEATGHHTRSSREVSTYMAFSLRNTRSGEQDTLLYLVNYSDNQGFALLGGNPAINDIYAISHSGQLTLEDIQENPVLADFFIDAFTYASTYEFPPIDPGITFEWKYWRYGITGYTAPMLRSSATNWTQLAPYNAYCPKVKGSSAPVGCGPLSLGMLLSYYELPVSLKYTWNDKNEPQFNFDWETMLYGQQTSKVNPTDTIAKMLAFLGCANLLNTKYGVDSAATNHEDIAPTLKKLGSDKVLYDNKIITDKNIDSISGFILNGFKTLTSIYKAAPLITMGINDKTDDAHAWIIDGVVTRKRRRVDQDGKPLDYTFIPDDPAHPLFKYEKALPLFHCVWGQAGSLKKCDGWYLYMKYQIMDSIQYNPFDTLKNINREGMSPTGIKNYARYRSWRVYGGAFPSKPQIIKPNL